MTTTPQSSTRLYVLLAREAPVAVVFRRGPSKQVLLLKWQTDSDTFVEGQWFKGRIYERRCDLSPSGQKLIYFAGKFKKPYYTWIAISRPPYLTALALLPVGSTWTSGGLFGGEDEILLGSAESQPELAKGFEVPRWVKVKPQPYYSGVISEATRLIRDGWRVVQQGENWWYKLGSPINITMDPPTILAKKHPRLPYTLKMILHGYSEPNGPWEVVEHQVVPDVIGETTFLGRSDWADWDHLTGDLLFAWEGRLFRQQFTDQGAMAAKELIDLRDRTFEEREAPAWAKQWRS